jgi:hypothetical protein
MLQEYTTVMKETTKRAVIATSKPADHEPNTQHLSGLLQITTSAVEIHHTGISLKTKPLPDSMKNAAKNHNTAAQPLLRKPLIQRHF